jgi:hypothetical protein
MSVGTGTERAETADLPAVLGGARERSVDLLRGSGAESEVSGKFLSAGASKTTKLSYYVSS